ncbi:hypothetical protein Poli38472_006714 [Pythium oligandrum]|uniref:Exocyst complex component n=1 Tax=Pythium oligandrum TaxID=41045 RepID=A0A8K1C595_PYTOL|nr:hypothetical protein Poli38472_006714 [Pythium oligandrum]|eukprot:TMW56704.1 hypothetical protein Poli38472_006714 [Pythium oligandrum]
MRLSAVATERVGTNYATTSPETDLGSPSFDAKQYLAVTHACTSYSSLQDGLKELKRTTSDKTEQLKALVTAHFDQYLTCHEAVRGLSDDIRTHQKESDQLVTDMKTLKQVTDSTLSVMLQRAKEQRRIRNTLAVLIRFRPIFEITTKMKESLQSKDYEKLAEDYCRLKFHHSKTHIAALQPVLAAAHEVARKANTELLQHFDDTSLSVKDQKRAITVLEVLGLVEKPIVTCLRKQFDYLEKRLAALPPDGQPAKVISDCGAVIYRFRSGLWGFICDVFKPVAGGAAAATVITSAEAEVIQQKAWGILARAVELIEKNSSPPTAALLKQLNESFREILSLKNCANATLLNDNITQLKSSFCEKFRIKIVLQFIQQTCTKHRESLMTEYFEAVVRIPSMTSESSVDLTTTGMDETAPSSNGEDTIKVTRLISEACNVFDEISNTSMVSSESKVHIYRASVLTACATDVMKRCENIWNQLGQVLMEMAEGTDLIESSNMDTKAFRSVLVGEFNHQLHSIVSMFFNTLLDKFRAAVLPPTTMASVSGSARNRAGPGVCVLFAIVSNCIQLREKHLGTVEQWVRQLNGGANASNSSEIHQLLVGIESKCVETYVAMHSEPLLRVLNAGSTEEAQQTRAFAAPPSTSASASRTDSLRLDSRTGSSTALFNIVPPPTPTAIAAAASVGNSIPQDCRQYVFNVLLQLITLRSEVESSLGQHPVQCLEYMQSVSFQLTAILGRYLHESFTKLEVATEPSEWQRIHLLVEARFFLFALRDLLSEDTKIQLIAVEKTLEKTKPGEKVAMAQLQLLSQLKHQTKLYLLALQQASS